jgi:hypothetical protein
MHRFKPVVAALIFLPMTDFAVAWVVAGSAIVGLSLVGCLVVLFGRPGAKARLGV